MPFQYDRSREYVFGLTGRGHTETIERIILSRSSPVVLNIGCSAVYEYSANLAMVASLVGGAIIAGDKNPVAVEMLEGRHRARRPEPGKMEFRVLDAAALALPDSSVDVVLALGLYNEIDQTLYKTTNGAFQRRTFREFFRVNKAGGHVILGMNSQEPVEFYELDIEAVGYKFVEKSLSRDAGVSSSTPRRYLLCYQK